MDRRTLRRALSRLGASRAGRVAATLAIAAAGGLAFAALGLPTPMIGGAIVAVFVAILLGFEAEVPQPLRNVVFVFLGIVAGANVRPEVLAEIGRWPASFAILGISVLGVILATYAWLRRVAGWDAMTALFAALPGALSFVMAAAADTRADLRRVAVLQSFRVIALVLLVPPLIHLAGAGHAGAAHAARPVAGGLDLLLLVAAGAIGGAVGHVTRLPGGLMLGALVASAALALAGHAEGTVPTVLAAPALVVLGAGVASRFRPADRALLPTLLLPTLVAFALGLGLSLLGALAVVMLVGAGFGEALLAFAPGALEAIVSLAVALDADPAFVAAHHLVRFLAIAAAVPIIARHMARGDRNGADGRR